MHAFFTKSSNNDAPIELPNKLNLFSNIYYAQRTHSDKSIQVNIKLKPKIADSL